MGWIENINGDSLVVTSGGGDVVWITDTISQPGTIIFTANLDIPVGSGLKFTVNDVETEIVIDGITPNEIEITEADTDIKWEFKDEGVTGDTIGSVVILPYEFKLTEHTLAVYPTSDNVTNGNKAYDQNEATYWDSAVDGGYDIYAGVRRALFTIPAPSLEIQGQVTALKVLVGCDTSFCAIPDSSVTIQVAPTGWIRRTQANIDPSGGLTWFEITPMSGDVADSLVSGSIAVFFDNVAGSDIRIYEIYTVVTIDDGLPVIVPVGGIEYGGDAPTFKGLGGIELTPDKVIFSDAGGIEYGGDAPVITGHERIITPPASGITYSGNIGITTSDAPTIITGSAAFVPAGGIVYAGGGIPFPIQQAIAPAGGILYNGTAPIILGNERIITPPAGGIVYAGDVPIIIGHERIITPLAGGIVYDGIVPVITGHERIITPLAGGILYSGGGSPGVGIIVPAGGIVYYGYGTSVKIYPVPAGGIEYGGINPSIYFENISNPQCSIVFICILTGSPDGLDDIELPISSFQSRLRDGTPTYLGVQVPNAVLYEPYVSDRPNGELVVSKGIKYVSGEINYSELVRVDLESVADNTGPKNSTMSLSGHSTTSNPGAKTVTISGIQTTALQADGKRRIRCDVDFFAKPGDTVEWGVAESMIAGLITITVGKLAYMDITEAE